MSTTVILILSSSVIVIGMSLGLFQSFTVCVNLQHNLDSAAILDTNMRSKPVVSHSKKLGTECKMWRISSGEDLGSTVVFEDCADGTEFAQQCVNMYQTTHCSRKGNVLTFHSRKCNAFLGHGAPEQRDATKGQ